MENAIRKLQEAQQFVKSFQSRARSIEIHRQILADKIKSKQYYLEMIESYTALVADVEEDIKRRQRIIEQNESFVDENATKFDRLKGFLEQDTERTLRKIERIKEKIKNAEQD